MAERNNRIKVSNDLSQAAWREVDGTCTRRFERASEWASTHVVWRLLGLAVYRIHTCYRSPWVQPLAVSKYVGQGSAITFEIPDTADSPFRRIFANNGELPD
jgi:hypothetical protein